MLLNFKTMYLMPEDGKHGKHGACSDRTIKIGAG
jgi:hypothetical protein